MESRSIQHLLLTDCLRIHLDFITSSYNAWINIRGHQKTFKQKPRARHQTLPFVTEKFKDFLTTELWQMSFSNTGRNSRRPRGAEVERSHPRSSSDLRRMKGSKVIGVGSLAGGGSTATTCRDPNKRNTRRSFSRARWSPKSAT